MWSRAHRRCVRDLARVQPAAPRSLSLTLALGLATAAGCSGSAAEITTQTAECAANVTEGLAAFAQELGLPYEVADGDGQFVLDNGSIAKQYARDGVRYEVGFRPQVDEGACELVFHKRVQRQPGSRESRHGYFGGYPLERCECE
jgi:hypothetical protein